VFLVGVMIIGSKRRFSPSPPTIQSALMTADRAVGSLAPATGCF